jgi:hypothetical protein
MGNCKKWGGTVYNGKKIISRIMIIVLTITLIIMSFKYKDLLEKYNWQQHNANIEVKADLSIASSSIGGYSITNENYNNYRYRQSITMIASGTQLLQFTTFNNNNSLLLALDNLLSLMEQDEYTNLISLKSNSINKELLKLYLNPEDKKATDNLAKLEEEIRQKN